MFALARHLGEHPTMIGALVGSATANAVRRSNRFDAEPAAGPITGRERLQIRGGANAGTRGAAQ
jgi:hypothetical protein